MEAETPYWTREYFDQTAFQPVDHDLFDSPSFDKTEVEVLRTARFYFVISIRKLTTHKRMKRLMEGDMIRSQAYNVLVKGAKGIFALSKMDWEGNGDAWKHGATPYVDLHYWQERLQWTPDYTEWYDEDQQPNPEYDSNTFSKFPNRSFATCQLPHD